MPRLPSDYGSSGLGLLVHAELPVFYSPCLLPFLDFIWDGQEEVFVAFRNHPSFISSALGNELHPLPGKGDEFLAAFKKFYERAKKLNLDALAMSTDGWTLPPADVYSLHRGYMPGKPTIGHEFGGWLCWLPGFNSMDLSLNKRLPVGGGRALEFNATGFDLLNHANWNYPDTNIGPESAPNVDAGRIIGSHGGRVMQIGLKFSF